MSRVTILSTVNTKSSKLKALDWIRRKPLNALFLDFPIYQESFFRKIAGGRDWREVLRRMPRTTGPQSLC
ncbi:MAG: hypothetical protein QME59_02145 [Candidatus Hydrothermarchaeota archaeon]|nr:hypothetical protein [Candidatus Hydrothermarchaeota archaeon]